MPCARLAHSIAASRAQRPRAVLSARLLAPVRPRHRPASAATLRRTLTLSPAARPVKSSIGGFGLSTPMPHLQHPPVFYVQILVHLDTHLRRNGHRSLASVTQSATGWADLATVGGQDSSSRLRRRGLRRRLRRSQWRRPPSNRPGRGAAAPFAAIECSRPATREVELLVERDSPLCELLGSSGVETFLWFTVAMSSLVASVLVHAVGDGRDEDAGLAASLKPMLLSL